MTQQRTHPPAVPGAPNCHRGGSTTRAQTPIREPTSSVPELAALIPQPVEGSSRPTRRLRLHDRGAVTAEKALLIAVVIMFGWIGVRFVGDPLRDPVFRVIFGILLRIYELIATMFGGVR